MPLPKDCTISPSGTMASKSGWEIGGTGPRPQLHRRRSNLDRRKFASESDLLLDRQDSDCGYMAIDPVLDRLPLPPSLSLTLPSLSPAVDRKRPNRPETIPTIPKSDYPDVISRMPIALSKTTNSLSIHKPIHQPGLAHTLPRQKMSPPADCECQLNPLHGTSQRVQFCLGSADTPVMSTSTLHTIDCRGDTSSFIDCSLRLKQRLRLPESGFQLDWISETAGHQCGPWYDLWNVDHVQSVADRVYEIAQL